MTRYTIVSTMALTLPFIVGKGDLSPWISFSLLLILMTYGLYRYIIEGHCGRWARFLVMALILFDLSAYDWSPANKITEDANGRDEMTRLLSLRGVADFLRSKPGPFRVEFLINKSPNVGDMYGIEETLGAAVTLQKDYDNFLRQADLLNVRYAIGPASTPEPGYVYADSAWKVYEKPNAYPRAWLVHAIAVEPNPKKLLERLNAPGVDPHRIALVAFPLSLTLQPWPKISSSQLNNEEAIWRKSRQDRVEVNVRANGRALLVLSELFYPGWTATVNGIPTTILKVDGALRGIVVPDGDSRVRLSYAPRPFLTGLMLTFASLAAGIVLVFRLWLRVRRAG